MIDNKEVPFIGKDGPGLVFLGKDGRPEKQHKPEISFNQGGRFFNLYLNTGYKIARVFVGAFHSGWSPAVSVTLTWGRNDDSIGFPYFFAKFDLNFKWARYASKREYEQCIENHRKSVKEKTNNKQV